MKVSLTKVLMTAVAGLAALASIVTIAPSTNARTGAVVSIQDSSQVHPGPISAADRKALLDLMTKTKEDFIASIRGLNAAQWDFKPSPFSWSVAQASEHIILSEDYIFGYSQQLLKSPAQARTGRPSGDEDKGVLTRVGDRSHRIMNPAAIAPKGRFKTPDEAIAAFTAKRDHNIEYVKTTQDDLRFHLSPDGSGGQMDAYELLLLMAGHSGRHTQQIKEVEANPKYPAGNAH